MATRKPNDKAQLKVRLREKLRAALEAAAAGRDASLNDEIVKRLEASFDVEHRVAELRSELEQLRERADNGYEELAAEVRELRRAIVRGTIDPEERN